MSSHEQYAGVPPPSNGFYHRRTVSEDTPLLAAVSDVPYSHAAKSPNETLPIEDLVQDEIDPNELDLAITRTISSEFGMSSESQETALLQGSRKASESKGMGPGLATVRRIRSRESRMSGTDETAEALNESEDDEHANISPYLGGISVPRFWMVYGCTLANLFIACFDTTIMASSHPVITSYFKSSNSASWLSTAFLLTSTAFQPLFGRLSDTIGRKLPYICSMIVFLAGTIWCALAQSITSFIVARAVCGLGAGGMMTMGSIITSDLVPIETRGVYQSYINIVFGLGQALGAATGGLIADSLGWRWEFGVQAPFIITCAVVSYFAIPRNLGLLKEGSREGVFQALKAFDYGGSIALSGSITFLILGLNIGGNLLSWSHPFIIFSLCISALGFPLFLYIESRATRPIMPLRIIHRVPRANIIFANAIANIVISAILFNVPLYIQAVLLESATNSGLRLLTPTLATTIAGTMTGFLITWSKRLKWSLVLGVLLILVGTSCLSFTWEEIPSWLYLVFLALPAIGQGFMFPGCFISILAVSDRAEQAVVTSTLILWRSLGNITGISISSLVVQNALISYLNKLVTGPEKEKIILQVRESVKAILKLEPHYQAQVVEAYAASLRVAFILLAALSLVATAIILPVRLPRLGKR